MVESMFCWFDSNLCNFLNYNQMQFKNYQRQDVDLIQHCTEYKDKFPDLRIHIGCDSIAVNGKITYFLVIAFRFENNGAHFIYHKEIVPVSNKTDGKWGVFMKLRHEAELSINLANKLVEELVFTKDQIILELDFNNIIDTLYKGLIPEMQGLATSMGFHTMVKFKEDLYRGQIVTEDLIAVKAADHLCQGIS